MAALRIGVLLPPADVLPGVGAEVAALMRAWAEDVNRAGGIVGREIEIVFDAPAGDSRTRAGETRAFVHRHDPFAMVSSFTDGADAELAALAEELRIPLFATMSSHPRSSVAPNRYLRDLVAGIGEQGRALASFATARMGTKQKIAVVGSQPDGATVTLSRADAVIFLGQPAALPAVLQSAQCLFVPASLAHPALFEDGSWRGKVYLSFPIAPNAPADDGLARYRRLAEHAEVTRRNQVSHFAALASAQLLVAALECAGPDVTRENLVDCADRVTKLQTGLVPPLTYGPNRHIGSTGAFIVELHSEEPAVWIDAG